MGQHPSALAWDGAPAVRDGARRRSRRPLATPGQLSPRQQEVLQWTALGKTTWETSVIMKCAEPTVNYHLKQIFRRLGVNNKTHAVSRAIELGLFELKPGIVDEDVNQ
jgi:DNA-binding CsgD family transcriptional regulator